MSVLTRKTKTQPVEAAPVQEKISDTELLARIQSEFANRPPAPPRRITIAEMYQQAAALICSAMGYRTTRLKSETTAVRIYELTLMWALNNKGTEPSHDILDPEEIGDTSEGADEAPAPEPNETIEASGPQE